MPGTVQESSGLELSNQPGPGQMRGPALFSVLDPGASRDSSFPAVSWWGLKPMNPKGWWREWRVFSLRKNQVWDVNMTFGILSMVYQDTHFLSWMEHLRASFVWTPTSPRLNLCFTGEGRWDWWLIVEGSLTELRRIDSWKNRSWNFIFLFIFVI